MISAALGGLLFARRVILLPSRAPWFPDQPPDELFQPGRHGRPDAILKCRIGLGRVERGDTLLQNGRLLVARSSSSGGLFHRSPAVAARFVAQGDDARRR